MAKSQKELGGGGWLREWDRWWGDSDINYAMEVHFGMRFNSTKDQCCKNHCGFTVNHCQRIVVLMRSANCQLICDPTAQNESH